MAKFELWLLPFSKVQLSLHVLLGCHQINSIAHTDIREPNCNCSQWECCGGRIYSFDSLLLFFSLCAWSGYRGLVHIYGCDKKNFAVMLNSALDPDVGDAGVPVLHAPNVEGTVGPHTVLIWYSGP